MRCFQHPHPCVRRSIEKDYIKMTRKAGGQKPWIETIDLLGFVSWYLKSSARQYSICPIFGLVPTTLSVWIDYGILDLHKATAHIPECSKCWPSPSQTKEITQLLQLNFPNGHLLRKIFAVVDGWRFPCSQIRRSICSKNEYYEGYTANVDVSNLFFFNFYGELIHAAVKFQGSWHESWEAWQYGLRNMHSLEKEHLQEVSLYVQERKLKNGISEPKELPAVDLVYIVYFLVRANVKSRLYVLSKHHVDG